MSDLPSRSFMLDAIEWSSTDLPTLAEQCLYAYAKGDLLTKEEAMRYAYEQLGVAIEGAPTLLYPDGNGGVTFRMVNDEAIVAAATKMSEEQGWNDDERDGLYEALCDLIAALGITDEAPE